MGEYLCASMSNGHHTGFVNEQAGAARLRRQHPVIDLEQAHARGAVVVELVAQAQLAARRRVLREDRAGRTLGTAPAPSPETPSSVYAQAVLPASRYLGSVTLSDAMCLRSGPRLNILVDGLWQSAQPQTQRHWPAPMPMLSTGQQPFAWCVLTSS